MNHSIQKLISSKEILNVLPLSEKNVQNILIHRQEIKNILSGADNRLLLIIGPCSAWPDLAVLKYAKLLAELEKKVFKKIKIVMRVYPHKPRTTLGWHGSLMQPDPFAAVDINQGIKYSRKMMLEVVKLGLPIASEILNINLHSYFLDLLSWVGIGARSSENPEHRLFASYLDVPTGLKNPTHGSLEIAINSILTAQHPHTIVLDGCQISTMGNKFAHLVLRGGNKKPNFSNENIELINKLFLKHNLLNPAVIIDVNHDNSITNNIANYKLQPHNIFNILENVKTISDCQKIIKGFMVESFLEDGNQDLNLKDNLNLNGLSITDPCIGWELTEKLIMDIAKFS